MISISENLSKSFAFAKNGLVGHWVRWILLLIFSVIPIVNFISSGYSVKIYKGGDVAPELEGYVELFIDGLKLTIIGIVYTLIPIIIIQAGDYLIRTGEVSATAMMLELVGTILVFILSLFALIAGVRFAKTGSMKEAFNFSAVLEKIREIGWMHYILSYIVIIIVIVLIIGILSGVAVALFVGGMVPTIALLANGGISFASVAIGWILLFVLLILMPVITIWAAKFYENLYSLA